MIAWLTRWWCARRGHDMILEYSNRGMILRCVSCGKETPGWSWGIGQADHE